MKFAIIFAAVLLAACLLSGCSGLNVSWQMNASYNSNMQVMSGAVHQTSPVGGKEEK